MKKDEMMALVRSVAVPEDVEQGMSHAYDLGVEWAFTQAMKAVALEVDEPQASNAIRVIQTIYPNEDTTP